MIERLLARIAAAPGYLPHHEAAYRCALARQVKGGGHLGFIARRRKHTSAAQRFVDTERIWLCDPTNIPALLTTIDAAAELGGHPEMQPVLDWLRSIGLQLTGA